LIDQEKAKTLKRFFSGREELDQALSAAVGATFFLRRKDALLFEFHRLSVALTIGIEQMSIS